MKHTTEQFRVPDGSWHQKVRSNWERWFVGACLVNLDTRTIETRTTTEEPTCARCIQALEEHPELQTGQEQATTAPTRRQGSTKRSTKSGRGAPTTEAKPQKRNTGDVKNDAGEPRTAQKKRKVQKEPELPTLF